MVDRSMKGVFPILSTPTNRKGQTVLEDLKKQVEWMIENGVHGVGIAIASEIYKYSEEERDEILKTVVEQSNGRIKVVMNTGAESSNLAIHYSKRAIDLGADALMIRPASFIPTPANDQINYFVDIAENVTVPIFLQDQGTAPVTPSMAIECAKRHENLCYIKVETPPTIPRMKEISEAKSKSDIIVFGGAGGAFCVEEFKRGSVGTMPGSTMPDVWVEIWKSFSSGDVQEAQALQDKFTPIIKILAQTQGLAPWIYKYVMVKRGVFDSNSGYVRGPSLKPDDLHLREIDKVLENLELV
ncbi:dihydrodipicolinate synthase family protein [Dehalococcoidia bacterium]|nr:dihydrodipicolinate synthase family protein [Dehalococcoidia bacterium]